MSSMLSYVTATYRVLGDKVSEYWDSNNNNTENRMFASSGYYDQYKTFFCSPTHVINNIYIGSAFNAANYSQLNSLNIKVIINMTNEISIYFPDEYICKRFGVYDNDDADMSKYYEEIYNYIESHEDKNILIHCKMGASRSASVVIYYLIKKCNMSLDKAIEFLKEKRMIINPNNKFIDAIKKLFN